MLNKPVISENIVTRPTYLEIDLNALSHNYRAIQKAINGNKIMAILKANAYGHGLVRIAQHLQSIDIDYVGVAYLEEGIMLRENGITTPILVMGGIVGHQIPYFLKYDLTITASSVDKLNQIEHTAQSIGIKAKVHLKIDTGMERIGIHYYNAHSLLETAHNCEHCKIEAIYTHFANADSEDLNYTQLQLNRLKKVLQFYEQNNIDQPWVHVGNSATILNFPEAIFDMVRAGLLLYGVYPTSNHNKKVEVRPILSWKTKVVFFKVIRPNHPVSYGGTWQSDKLTRIVTIPVGYGDGYFRSMSNKAQVLIRGRKYANVGTICMDQLMINVNWETAYNDDEVILIGQQGNETITIENLAEWANTIPYEILTNINTRVPRIYIEGQITPS